MRSSNFGTVAHEWAHNLGLMHASGTWGSGEVREYGEYSSIMGLGIDKDGWVGLNALNLRKLGWLPDSEVLEITGDGSYSLPNSLSSNTGVRAAHIAGAADFWIEWREPVNQDSTLERAEFFNSHFPLAQQGKLIGSLLVHSLMPRSGNTMLVGVVPPGTSSTIGSITISNTNSRSFRVSGTGRSGGGEGIGRAISQPTTRFNFPETPVRPTLNPGPTSSGRVVCATGNAPSKFQCMQGCPAVVASPNESFSVLESSDRWWKLKSCSGSGIWHVHKSSLVPCSARCSA